jgi:hypothetical protein
MPGLPVVSVMLVWCSQIRPLLPGRPMLLPAVVMAWLPADDTFSDQGVTATSPQQPTILAKYSKPVRFCVL